MKYKRLVDVLYNTQYLRYNEQSQVHHKKENVFSHLSQCYNIALKEAPNNPHIQCAALFHDIGKVIDNHGHEKYSLDILEAFGFYNEKVYYLINEHMRIRWLLSGRIKKLGKVRKLFDHPWFSDLCHIRRIDATGRMPNTTGRVPDKVTSGAWVPDTTCVLYAEEVNRLLIELNEEEV